MAIVHALALQKKEKMNLPIYTDSGTALAWLRNKKVKTTLDKTSETKPIYELIDRAEKWLAENEITVKIEKWHTSDWGEIPADFGRK